MAENPRENLAEKILDLLGSRGALFHSELVAVLDARPVEVEAALWRLVASGRVGADGFQALRSLLGSRAHGTKTRAGKRARRGLRRGLAAGPMSSDIDISIPISSAEVNNSAHSDQRYAAVTPTETRVSMVVWP